MRRYHLHKLVQLLSRVLPKILDQEILAKIGHKVSDIEDIEDNRNQLPVCPGIVKKLQTHISLS